MVSDEAMVIAVPRHQAEMLRKQLEIRGIVDHSRKIAKERDYVLIPLIVRPPVDFESYKARSLKDVVLLRRRASSNPRLILQAQLAAAGVPLRAVPRRWQRIGDVIVIRIPPGGRAHAPTIGRVLGETLRAKTVVEDVSGIHGPLRTPDVRVLWGKETETVHTEGGIRYRLDVARVMFSAGNLAERMGVAGRIRRQDVVVDLFAGIGYFVLPIAVRARPAAVYACELNPVSFRYLEENIRVNRADSVVPVAGDCRTTAPEGIADWVLMGHFDARAYLDVAFRCLRGKGTIVYHELCPKEQVPEQPIARIAEAARTHWMQVLRVDHRIVKSYAPGIFHVAVQARVGPTTRPGPKGISADDSLQPRVNG